MDEGYRISYVDEPAWGVIGQGIRDFNTQQAGDAKDKYLCFVLYAPDHSIAGGVIGETHWEWFYIILKWIKEELRGRGYGHQLLLAAE